MTEERAVLAGGCFWGMQDLIRKLPGVVSTRVGYTGGEIANATYRNHEGHAEAIEIVFDPARTSYPRAARVLLPDPRSDHAQPSGRRRRLELPLGDLLRRRGAEGGGRGYHRRCRGLGPVAGQGRHRSHPGRRVLGSRARAPGLPRAVSLGLFLPLSPAELGSAATGGGCFGKHRLALINPAGDLASPRLPFHGSHRLGRARFPAHLRKHALWPTSP